MRETERDECDSRAAQVNVGKAGARRAVHLCGADASYNLLCSDFRFSEIENRRSGDATVSG